MSFASAIKSIGSGIKDLSQLNVRTYTGTMSANVDGDDAEAMLDAARQSGAVDGLDAVPVVKEAATRSEMMCPWGFAIVQGKQTECFGGSGMFQVDQLRRDTRTSGR